MPFGLGGVNYVLNFYIQQNRTYTPGASLSSTPGLRGYDPRPFVRAPILRMPNLIGLVQPFAPEIVKLDIEGAEWGLFAPEDTEMRRWLAQGSAQQIAIEFHDRFINGATRRTARAQRRADAPAVRLPHAPPQQERRGGALRAHARGRGLLMKE